MPPVKVQGTFYLIIPSSKSLYVFYALSMLKASPGEA